MSSLKKSSSLNSSEKDLSVQQQEMINEVRELLGTLAAAMPNFATDAMICRFLRLRSWNVQKASKAMKEAIKWRSEYKPEAINWEDVASEAEAGRIYKADYLDKQGRPVVILRPGYQSSGSAARQLKCFVYHLENVVMNMPEGQDQAVMLSDFQGWTFGSTPLKQSRASLHILQNYYPEILGLSIVYNPPKLFETFWKLLKPFLEDRLYESLKFVYSNNSESKKVITDNFDMEVMEEAYGGKNRARFDIDAYAKRMREEDKKMEARKKATDGSFCSDSQEFQSVLKEAQPCSVVTEAGQDGEAETSTTV